MQTAIGRSKAQKLRIQHLLEQFGAKILEFSDLKVLMQQELEVQPQEINNLSRQPKLQKQEITSKTKELYSHFQEFGPAMKALIAKDLPASLKAIYDYAIKSVTSTSQFYELQLKKCRAFYETEIWDLREEIKRQYKVIGLMKQEVEDLMMLMKYQSRPDTGEDNSEQIELDQSKQQLGSPDSSTSHIKMSNSESRYAGQLEVIEEETQRTFQSSDRSHCTTSNNEHTEKSKGFIKIEEKDDLELKMENQMEEEERNTKKELDLQNQNSLQKWKKELNLEQPDHNQVTQIQFNPKLDSKQLRENLNNLKADTLLLDSTSIQSIQNNEIPIFPSPVQSLQLTPVQSRISSKNNTGVSENLRQNHLQSIFFLDDDGPEETSLRFKQITNQEIEYKLQFCQKKQNHNVDMKQVHHYIQEEEYSLFEDHWAAARERKGQVKEEDILKVLKKDINEIPSHGNLSSKPKCESKNQISGVESSSKSNQTLSHEEGGDDMIKTFSRPILVQQFQSSASVPISTASIPLSQLCSNTEGDKEDQKSLEGKPKTKQFLEQFRKTFNKCLKSMQVSKKNSTKLANTTSQKHGGRLTEAEANGVMTFGKSNQSSNYSSIGCRELESMSRRDKENLTREKDLSREKINSETDETSKGTMKVVDHMLKELQNSNKFMIGNKKIELKYEGQKRNGLRSGNGVLYYSNGLCYEGEFKDGLRHGYGILKFNHIQIYNGDWVHDEIEGQGKIRNCAIINKKKTTYCSTALGKWISYSGEFKTSKFDGSGTLYLQGGEKFVGRFENGFACGDGFVYKKNGEVDHGIWRNNIMIESGETRIW